MRRGRDAHDEIAELLVSGLQVHTEALAELPPVAPVCESVADHGLA